MSMTLWSAYRRWRSRWLAPGWPITEATIQSDFAADLGSRYSSAYACYIVLQYSYQLAGEFYSGYLRLLGTFPTHEDAHAAARPWLDKKISVRYNPARPQESVFLVADGAPEGLRSLGNQPPDSSDLIDFALK